jgi:uncharacterized membrane protein YheB (UPF0754 family)
MKNVLFVFLMGVIGAWIGWLTNVLAIKLLFRPYQEYRVPLVGWKIQGLIPKRQRELAVGLGSIVSTELLKGSDVLASLSRQEMKMRLRKKTESYVREKVLKKMPFLIPAGIQISLAGFVAKTLGQEVEKFLQNPGKIFRENELDEIRREISKIVAENVMRLNMAKLEELVYSLAKRELKHIEIIGAFLGLIIGIIQGIISIAWTSSF